jgi:hypothetical protein
MTQGTIAVSRPAAEVEDRLTVLLAAANCKVERQQDRETTFTHGSYQAQSAPLLPKSGHIRLIPAATSTDVQWEIHVKPAVAAWMTCVGVAFCWTIFAPLLVYRALKVEPQMFMENLLAGL